MVHTELHCTAHRVEDLLMSLSGQVLRGVLPDPDSCGNMVDDESASGTCANPDAAGRGAGEEGADVKQAGADNVIEYEPPNLVSGAGHDALPLAQLTKVSSSLRFMKSYEVKAGIHWGLFHFEPTFCYLHISKHHV